MTTNSQNLTFGEWLAAGGVSPNALVGNLWGPLFEQLRDDWKEGAAPSIAAGRIEASRSKP